MRPPSILRTASMSLLLAALPYLASCSTTGSEFRLSAHQVSGAWAAMSARQTAEFGAAGVEPLMNLPPRFSAARCRWIERGKEAMCRYSTSQRGIGGRGPWKEEERQISRTDNGWEF